MDRRTSLKDSTIPTASADLDLPEMTFSSSPVLYPQTSSPAPSPAPVIKSKRKLFQTFSAEQPALKRSKNDRADVAILDPNVEEDSLEKDLCGNVHLEKVEEHNYVSAKILVQDGTDSSQEEPRLSTVDTLPVPASHNADQSRKRFELETCSGQKLNIGLRKKSEAQSYEQLVAQRSVTAAGRAKKAYYGVDIHNLMDEAKTQRELDKAAKEYKQQNAPEPSIEPLAPLNNKGTNTKSQYQQMWTEKYRAKKFTELVGDERTHRSVLKWLKGWDSTVFPGNAKPKAKRIYEDKDADQDRQRKKILLLTGPPGLGKTTLAHVCAKQAGYEVLEINASDDRSRDVVKGRIKDALGTETVRGIQETGKARRAGRPVCIVVDEVDGVVTGSGGSGGEGGFMKALLDLVQLDQKNSSQPASNAMNKNGKKKGDRFRLMRPLILICNDVYAPSLRPLRNSTAAEIVHVRKPPIDKVIARLKTVFERESILCDSDAIRRLCESSWGLGTRKQNSVDSRGAGEGDIRGVLVQGEWIAHKLRSSSTTETRLTRKWVEGHLGELSSSSGRKGLGRGGIREVVERVFVEGAGLPNLPTALSTEEAHLVAESKNNPTGVADLRKRTAINALREMIDTCGDHDRLMTDCFATYPTQIFQDDTFLSKPNSSYEWLHFHDSLASRIFSGQEWELNKYLSTSACAFHHLFSAVGKGSSGWNEIEKHHGEESSELHPYVGLKADYAAYEAEKQNNTILTELQSGFSAPLLRMFSSVDSIAAELIPNVCKMLAPDVKPVVVGGSGGHASVASVRKESERNCVQYSVRAMTALGIEFEKVRIESEGIGGQSNATFALRMEPPIDSLSTYHFDKSNTSSTHAHVPTVPVRYAIRQVLDQELRKEKLLQSTLARQARVTKSINADFNSVDEDKENTHPKASTINDPSLQEMATIKPVPRAVMVKRDFFGRPIINNAEPFALSNLEPGSNSVVTSIENIAKSTARKGRAAGNAEDTAGSSGRTWLNFNEGFSNAVRKPITLTELMASF